MLTTADIAFRAQAMACCSDEAGNNLIHICILLGIHGTYWYLISFQFLYEAFRVCFFAAVHIAKWHTSTWWDVHLVRLVFWIYLELLSLWRIIGDRILFFFFVFLRRNVCFSMRTFHTVLSSIENMTDKSGSRITIFRFAFKWIDVVHHLHANWK